MLVGKQKKGPVSDSDGATGAHRLVGARPVERHCGSDFDSVKEKSNRSIRVKGACPLALLPLGGGGSRAISTQTKKLGKDILQSQFFLSHVIKNREPLFIYMPCITLEYG